MKTDRPIRSAHRAFTLIELLVAVAIFAIILVAINTVFYAALRLRNRTTANLDRTLPLNRALSVMRRDLANVMPPGGPLAGGFIIGAIGSGGINGVSIGGNTGTVGSQSGSLECYTTTGTLSDAAPWGEVQQVTYQLLPPQNPNEAIGKDLVRTVTRNLLATSTQIPVQQILLRDVDQIQFAGYDGTQWRDSWDTTTTDTNLPQAVRVLIQLATTNHVSLANQQPLELLVLLDAQSPTNQATTNVDQE